MQHGEGVESEWRRQREDAQAGRHVREAEP